jgi:23S rRNA pseudouridine1911/1915/1917 synthase
MENTERHVRLRADPDAAVQRLDRFLADAQPELSRSRLKRLIEAGHVKVGGETIAEPSHRVKPGATIDLVIPPAVDDGRPAAEPLALDIIYEDDDIVVVNKPAGMAVHPAPGTPSGTLVNALIAHCGDSLSGIGGVRRPGIVHRLDKDTSGLIVAAKHDRAHAALAAQFASRTLSRTYLALVWGVPTPRQGELSGNIGRSRADRKKMSVLKSGGKPALTRYRVVKTLAGAAFALVECRLATGRTHQIRVQLSAAGHPLVGDATYGGRRRAPLSLSAPARAAVAGFKRQALHAFRLGLAHPSSGERLSFEVPLSDDFALLLKELENRT